MLWDEWRNRIRKDILKRSNEKGNAIWSYGIKLIETETDEEYYLLMCYEETEAKSFQN